MWIDTKQKIPPDEWFFLPGDKKMLTVGIGEYNFPKIIILSNECGKNFFENKVLYWQWIDELPAPMLELIASRKVEMNKPDLCEDLPIAERTSERIERRARFHKKMIETADEELRLKYVRFENWAKNDKPTADPMEYAEQTGIGLPPPIKPFRKLKKI